MRKTTDVMSHERRICERLVKTTLKKSEPVVSKNSVRDRVFVCRNTSRLRCSRGAALLAASHFGRVVGPPTASRRNGPSVRVGVLAGTHWGDDSSRVTSHQSANPCGCVV